MAMPMTRPPTRSAAAMRTMPVTSQAEPEAAERDDIWTANLGSIVAAAKFSGLREDFSQFEAWSVLADKADALAGEDGAAVADAGAAAHALFQERLHGLAAADAAEHLGHGGEHGVGSAGKDLVRPRGI